MTDIEEVVRRALVEQVHRQPAMTGPADRAIAGARAARRRQAALSVSAVLVVLVATVAGVATLRDRVTGPAVPPPTGRPPASPVPQLSPSATGPSLPKLGLSAVTANNLLLTPDGRRLSLAQLAGVRQVQAYQVHDGWLVLGGAATLPDRESLWLVHADGTSRQLIDNAEGITVAPDGKRVAWSTPGTLAVGHVDGDKMVKDASTPFTGRGGPLAFAGAALVIGYSETGGGIDHWDVWVPRQGPYLPSWATVQANGMVSVFGATADGRYAIGVALTVPGSGGKDSCLAELDPMDTLRVVARACDVPVPGDWASISPDGHWMAYNAPGAFQTTVVDLTTVFQHPQTAATWPNVSRGVWTGPDTFVAPDPSPPARFYRYRVGQSAREQVEIRGLLPTDPFSFVPTLSQ